MPSRSRIGPGRPTRIPDRPPRQGNRRADLSQPFGHEPLLVLRFRDLKFVDRLPDRFLLIGGADMPDEGRWATLDADDPPFMVGLADLMIFGRFLGQLAKVISPHLEADRSSAP